MTTLKLTRKGDVYVANQARCGSCHGCGTSQNAIVLPLDISEAPSGAKHEDTLLLSFSATDQFKTLFYSWILPLLGCVATSLISSLAGAPDLVAAGMAISAFVAGLLLCNPLGIECLLLHAPAKVYQRANNANLKPD